MRYDKLMREHSRWWSLCSELAETLGPGKMVSIEALRAFIISAELKSYSTGCNYATVPFGRVLVLATGSSFADLSEDWPVWVNMSTHVHEVWRPLGLRIPALF